MKSLCFASLIVLVTACGADPASATDGTTVDSRMLPLECSSPFALPLDAQAETHARAALAQLSASAKLQWSAERGTLTSVSGLAVAMPGCSGDADAYQQLFAVLEASPDLFQIDRNDWRTDAPVSCASIQAGSPTKLVIRRIKYGPLDLRNDVFHATLARTDGLVVLRLAGGTYIPRASDELLARLHSCPELPAAELEARLRAQAFGYVNFEPPPAPICAPAGLGEYSATAADTLDLAPGAELMWDDGSAVTIRRVRSATLRVAPTQVTPELERSDANCPADDGSPQVGWIRFFDAITGAIVGDQPNPVPGCIVC